MKYGSQLFMGAALTVCATQSQATTLEQAVKDSLLWHPQVNASANSRYSAEQDLRAAKGGYLPSLDLTAARVVELSVCSQPLPAVRSSDGR